MNIKLLPMASGALLFGVSSILGYLGRPAEMGLAIVAGAIGFAFCNIDKISKFKGAGFEAEMHKQRGAESVITKQTDNVEHLKALGFEINQRREKIMSALLHTRYDYRYVIGISKESGISKEIVKEELEWLREKELANKHSGRKGYLWNLTEKGMALLPIVIFGKNLS